MNTKFDIKNVFIIVLSVVLIFMLIFNRRPKNENSNLKDLEKQNVVLQHQNDSLMSLNQTYDYKISVLNHKADSIENKLIQSEIKIKELNKKKNEIPKIINSMSANDVANSFSDIIANSKR
jgi:hypothetical protein